MDRLQARSGRAGFTLLEVLVALAIVGGVLVTLLHTINFHLSAVSRNETTTVGSLLALEKLDDLAGEAATGLKDTKGGFDEPYADYAWDASLDPTAFPDVSSFAVTVTRGADRVTFRKYVDTPSMGGGGGLP